MQTNEDDLTSQMDKKIPYYVFGPIITIFLVFLVSLLSAIWPIESTTVTQSGVFGDSFGILTALFSGLAFGGLIITIYYQKRDLGLTQKELRDTRHEMQLQHRENHIFYLLRVHTDLIGQLDILGEEIHSGRDCFGYFYKQLSEKYYRTMDINKDVMEVFESTYAELWNEWQQDLGHYFRTLYTIFEFLQNSDFNESDQKLYVNIVRAQLSNYELTMLFYNCLTKDGNKFKLIVEEFALFDNLPIDLIFDKVMITKFNRSAFGENQQALDCFSDSSSS